MVSLESLTDYILYYSFFYKKRLYYVGELCAVIYIINYVYKELKHIPLILEEPDTPHHDYLYPVYNKVVEKYGDGLIDYKQIRWYIRDFTPIRTFPQMKYVLGILSTCRPYKYIHALRIIDGV